jgi:hypothetical protein
MASTTAASEDNLFADEANSGGSSPVKPADNSNLLSLPESDIMDTSGGGGLT